jgi:hypothetical protein
LKGGIFFFFAYGLGHKKAGILEKDIQEVNCSDLGDTVDVEDESRRNPRLSLRITDGRMMLLLKICILGQAEGVK